MILPGLLLTGVLAALLGHHTLAAELHKLVVIVAAAVVGAHIYMAVLNPRTRGAMRGNQCGAKPRRTEKQDSDCDRSRVGGFHFIELRFYEATQSPDKRQTDTYSCKDHCQRISKNQPNCRPARSAKRQPDPDLAGALRYDKRHHSVQANQ